jgi:hypothetical protein
MSKRSRGPLDPSEVAKSPLAEAVLADLIARFAQHEAEDTLPRGPRGSFYDLRPEGMGNGVTYRKKMKGEPASAFGPMEAHIEYVGDVLGRARRAGLIPEPWVADGRAPDPIIPITFDDAEEFAANVVAWAAHFRLDAQRFQPVYVEVLCEAADLRPRVARIASEYGVPVYASGGMGGIKGNVETGGRARERHVPTVVLAVGDCDKDGRRIYAHAAEDSVAWAGDGYVYADGAPFDCLLTDAESNLARVSFFRVALTQGQAEQLDVLDAEGKAEADAIPVPVLDGWLREAIEGLQDSACAERTSSASRRPSANGWARSSEPRSTHHERRPFVADRKQSQTERKDMLDEQTTKHPARIDSLIEALLQTSEGEGVADALDFIFDNAPEFRLPRTPTDQWQYVQDLLAMFWEDEDLAERSLGTTQDALGFGVRIGEALAIHRSE